MYYLKKTALFMVLAYICGLLSAPVFAEEAVSQTTVAAAPDTASESGIENSSAAETLLPIPEPDATPAPSETAEPTHTPSEMPVSEETPSPLPEPTPKPDGLKANYLVIDIDIANVPNVIPDGAVFGIYTKDKVFLSAQKIDIVQANVTHTLVFLVPEYYTGEIFYLMPISGVKTVRYCDAIYQTGEYIPLSTFAYLPKTPEDTGVGNRFTVTATPFYDRQVNLWVELSRQTMKSRIKISDNYCIAPLYEFMVKLGVSVYNIQYNEDAGRIQIDHNGRQLVFFLDSKDVLVNGSLVQAETPTRKIGGETYIPLRFAAEKLGCTLTAHEQGDAIHIYITFPRNVPANSFVNARNISSQTDYMVWVSKSNYTVSVFHGYTNNWNCIRTFKCSIGAPATPTITGQYEYFSKESRWSYPTYYVGPIMRFYKGYALHSTLLRYDGSSADGRLGMQISHGCVRIHPDNMNWMVNNIPLHTKIYITE